MSRRPSSLVIGRIFRFRYSSCHAEFTICRNLYGARSDLEPPDKKALSVLLSQHAMSGGNQSAHGFVPKTIFRNRNRKSSERTLLSEPLTLGHDGFASAVSVGTITPVKAGDEVVQKSFIAFDCNQKTPSSSQLYQHTSILHVVVCVCVCGSGKGS